MASHRVHVHVHIGNHHTGRATSARARNARRSNGRRARGRKGKGRYNTTTGSKPGSGKNFAALKKNLARRGARNPGALAAAIGRAKYGNRGFAALSRKGRGRRR